MTTDHPVAGWVRFAMTGGLAVASALVTCIFWLASYRAEAAGVLDATRDHEARLRSIEATTVETKTVLVSIRHEIADLREWLRLRLGR